MITISSRCIHLPDSGHHRFLVSLRFDSLTLGRLESQHPVLFREGMPLSTLGRPLSMGSCNNSR